MVSRRASAAACATDSVGYCSKLPICSLRRTGFPLMSFSHQRYTHTAEPLFLSSSLPLFLSSSLPLFLSSSLPLFRSSALPLFQNETSLLIACPSKQSSSLV